MMTRTRTVKSLLAVAAVGLTTFAFANPLDKIWEASGTSGATRMKAQYVESPENAWLEQVLGVELENGVPNSRYVITINGSRVGSLRTNGIGDGRFGGQKNVQPGADGRPTGPRVEEGDTITVKNAQQSVTGNFVRFQ